MVGVGWVQLPSAVAGDVHDETRAVSPPRILTSSTRGLVFLHPSGRNVNLNASMPVQDKGVITNTEVNHWNEYGGQPLEEGTGALTQCIQFDMGPSDKSYLYLLCRFAAALIWLAR